MTFRTEEVDGFLVIHLAGSIRAEGNHLLEAFVKDLDLSAYRGVVFELSALEYLNSRAVGSLVAIWKLAVAETVEVAATKPRPLVARLLSSVGLYKLLPCHADLPAALKALKK